MSQPFNNRSDAGKKLAHALLSYQNNPDVIVIGLPRGGVVTAYEVAQKLHAPLDIIVPRKIGAPFQPELAVGALTQEGDIVWNTNLMHSLALHPTDLADIIAQETKEAARRLAVYRGDRPALKLKGKIVILVDDGIATGATMRAAIATARRKEAKSIVVAIPVAASDALRDIKHEVDEIICLTMLDFLPGISAAYHDFAQTADEQVIALMKRNQ